MPKIITCPYCGTTKTVRTDAETCGAGACRMRKSRNAKKERLDMGEFEINVISKLSSTKTLTIKCSYSDDEFVFDRSLARIHDLIDVEKIIIESKPLD